MSEQNNPIEDSFDVNLDRNQRKKIFFGKVCQRSKGVACPECGKSDELFKESKNTEDRGKKSTLLDQAKIVYARSKIFISAINVRDEDKSYPVRIYALPPSVYDDIMGQIKGARQLNPKTNVFHPITGRNILITRKGQGILTRYTVQIDSEPSELPNKRVLDALRKGDLSVLPNLEQVEEFIAANYLNIVTLDQETNIIRLVPPYDKNTIYKELKFHRYTVETFQQLIAKSDNPSVSNQPDFSSQVPNSTAKSDFSGKIDEFDPFDLNVGTSSNTPVSSPPVEVVPVVPPVVQEPQLDDIKAKLASISAGGNAEIEELLRKVQSITASAKQA